MKPSKIVDEARVIKLIITKNHSFSLEWEEMKRTLPLGNSQKEKRSKFKPYQQEEPYNGFCSG